MKSLDVKITEPAENKFNAIYGPKFSVNLTAFSFRTLYRREQQATLIAALEGFRTDTYCVLDTHL